MENKIIGIISDILGEDVNAETKVESVEAWTSLKMIQIVMALEDEGAVIPIEKIAQIHSVQDILNLADISK